MTEHELQLLEYSFFSLCEEVDIFYCRQKEAEFLSEPYTDDNMRETMLIIMEGLESYAPDSEKWHTFLRRLYLLSMGEYRTEKEPEKVEDEEKKEVKEPDVEDSNSSIVKDEEAKDEESKAPAKEEEASFPP